MLGKRSRDNARDLAWVASNGEKRGGTRHLFKHFWSCNAALGWVPRSHRAIATWCGLLYGGGRWGEIRWKYMNDKKRREKERSRGKKKRERRREKEGMEKGREGKIDKKKIKKRTWKRKGNEGDVEGKKRRLSYIAT